MLAPTKGLLAPSMRDCLGYWQQLQALLGVKNTNYNEGVVSSIYEGLSALTAWDFGMLAPTLRDW